MSRGKDHFYTPQEIDHWKSDQVFRWTFLRKFSPKEAAAMRRTGQVFYTCALEGGPPSDPSDRESWVRMDLQAVRADLLSLQDFLAGLGENEEEELFYREQFELCQMAAGLSLEVGKIVQTLTAAVGAGDYFRQVLEATSSTSDQ